MSRPKDILKTSLLFIPLLLTSSFIAWFIGGALGAFAISVLCFGIFVALVLAADSTLLRQLKVVEASRSNDGGLTELVERICGEIKVVVPRVYLIHDRSPNVFLFGVLSGVTHLAVSDGVIAQLDRAELEAVLTRTLLRPSYSGLMTPTLCASLLCWMGLPNAGREVSKFLGASNVIEAAPLNGKEADWGLTALAKLVFMLPVWAFMLKIGSSKSFEVKIDLKAAQEMGSPFELASGLQKISYGMASVGVPPAYVSLAQVAAVSAIETKSNTDFLAIQPKITTRTRTLLDTKEVRNSL